MYKFFSSSNYAVGIYGDFFHTNISCIHHFEGGAFRQKGEEEEGMRLIWWSKILKKSCQPVDLWEMSAHSTLCSYSLDGWLSDIVEGESNVDSCDSREFVSRYFSWSSSKRGAGVRVSARASSTRLHRSCQFLPISPDIPPPVLRMTWPQSPQCPTRRSQHR